jgi:SAM-dependent methyltransferase
VSATVETSRRDAAAGQLFQGVIGALETLYVYLGDRLGLYTALRALSDASPGELAAEAGIGERYAREWLEQQAVAGLLDVVNQEADPAVRRFRLPAEVAELVTDPDSLSYMAPLARMVAGIAQTMPALLEAIRSGDGVPYSAYGQDLRQGVAAINRPMFLHQLASQWIPAMPDIEARLQSADPPPQVADLGCGTGWSSISLARGYPAARVDGLDLDEASVTEARRNAEDAGVANRVHFDTRNVGDPALSGRYHLITVFGTLHDMADPVRVLRGAAAMLAPAGTVLVGDEKVAQTFTAPGDDMERFMYGWSALHCLPASLTEPGSVGTGTAMRPDTLRRYARDAGFSRVTVLPIDHDVWRFYRLDP